MKTAIRETVFVRKSFYSFFLPSMFSCLGIAAGGLADCVFVGNTIGPVGMTAISIGQPQADIEKKIGSQDIGKNTVSFLRFPLAEGVGVVD